MYLQLVSAGWKAASPATVFDAEKVSRVRYGTVSDRELTNTVDQLSIYSRHSAAVVCAMRVRRRASANR